tara:strand:- start:15439 stop:18594 length:3156 start_codon:yes stop_codon:yes gene_type:complete
MGSRNYRITNFSVNRPVTVVMMFFAIIVVGIIAYTRIPLALLPEGINWPGLHAWVSYPNAGAIEVERKITRPMEEAVAQVNNVSNIESGANRGSGYVRVEFQKGTNLQVAFAQMKDRLERIMPEMPDEVEQISVRSWDQNDIPIIVGNISFPEQTTDLQFLLDSYVDPAFRRIDGVGDVRVFGESGKEVVVEVDREKVDGHRINLARAIDDLRSQNFNLPGGWIVEGGKKIFLRSLGRYENVEEMRRTVIDTAHQLELQDIASVDYRRPKKQSEARINGQQAMGFQIVRSSEANVVQVSKDVEQVVEQLKSHPRLKGIQTTIFWDQGKHAISSVNNLINSGLWGGLFAAGVLFFFLRAVRMTLIITLAIPLCILMTVTVLYFLGWSLNMATMMGLLLSLGLVVDNAIVIVENIYSKRQSGVSAREASIVGAGEVSLAVTMATLTTVVVFLPIILMSSDDMLGFWMLRIGLPVIVGLVASLGIALIIIPLAALKLGTVAKSNNGYVLRLLRTNYERLLKWILSHRTDAFIIVLLTFSSIWIPMSGIERTDQENRDESRIQLRFEMPSGQSLERTDDFFTSVEQMLQDQKDQYNIKDVMSDFSAGSGTVQLYFNDVGEMEWYEAAWEDFIHGFSFKERSHMSYQEVKDDLKDRLLLPPGTEMKINWEGGESEEAFNVTLYGEDTRVLMGLAQEVERRLEQIPGLASVDTDLDRGGNELQLRLDRTKLQNAGISAQMVSSNISYALRGYNLGKYHTKDGREVNIQVKLEEADRKTLDDLRALNFEAKDGREIPLESLADIYVQRTLGGIRRDDRQTMLNVVARADEESAEKLFILVDQAMEGLELPRGYSWSKGDRYERLQQQDDSMYFAVIMSVTFVFLLMGVLFESFVLPLSVLVSIPFSFLGVYWTLYLTNTPQDVMSMVGMCILIGVVVNNAIVLIDLANRIRRDGSSRMDALVAAGKQRFRPILMTTFTTALGLIPMAVGNSKMIGLAYAPLGRTMIGGLLASMLLTLLLVPLFYTFFDDLRIATQHLLSSVGHRKDTSIGSGNPSTLR